MDNGRRPYSEVIYIRVTPDQKRELNRIAAESERTLTQELRRLVNMRIQADARQRAAA